MLKKLNSLLGQKGSMMVEALAMLGLISMVTPVLYKKAAERTTELQDINTATQMRTLSKALDDYIQDNYVALAGAIQGGTASKVDKDDIAIYLPYGFNIDQSKVFSGYEFAIRNDKTAENESILTGMVLAKNSGDLPAIRSAKIASMIGSNGGVVNNNIASGVQGGWEAPLADFKLGTAENGSIASTSLNAVSSSAGVASDEVLYRTNSRGDIEYNTMRTDLYMGGKPIRDVNHLIVNSENSGLDKDGLMIGSGSDGKGAANLVVTGKGTITNLLKAGAANVGEIFKVETAAIGGANKITADAKVNANNGVDVKGSGAGKGGGYALGVEGGLNVTTGMTVLDGKLQANDGAEISNGVLVKGGKAGEGNGNIYSVVINKSNGANDGSLLVQNNVRIENDLYVGGKAYINELDVDNFRAGKIAENNYNLNVTKNDIVIKDNDFKVGDRIVSNDTSVTMKSANYQMYANDSRAGIANSARTNRVDVEGSNIYLQTPNGTGVIDAKSSNFTTDASKTIAIAGAGKLNIDGTSSYIQTVTDGKTNRVLTNKDGSEMTSSDGTNSAYISTTPTLAKASANNIVIDDRKIVFAEGAKTLGTFNSGNFDNAVINKGVIIRREGMVNLPGSTASGRTAMATGEGAQDVAGYIKADRFLANQQLKAKDPYAVPKDVTLTKPSGVTDNTLYDAYQVNPAYTSVMHDIKLTSRGGARLSDILPDFINKGIYVIDNTYKENSTSWEKYTVKVTGGKISVTGEPPSCSGDPNCIATPWLGFIPTPQCPPGYSKVITINPIRWKMAEAYAIPVVDSITGSTVTEKFKALFIAPRNPKTAMFKLTEENGNNPHRHYLESGMPLTFQTNTWLNTTIAGVRSSNQMSGANHENIRANDFLGWHAIMGFLYHGSDYHDYIKLAGGNTNNTDGKIVWNLFPVYNEELTAIANVYCYFERRNKVIVYDTDGSVLINKTVNDWNKNDNVVDTTYNQLENFRASFGKDSNYTNRLNDPALKYNDPW